MEEQKKIWPYRPTFLSLRAGKTEFKDSKDEVVDYNNDGIYHPDVLRGFLADLAHEEDVNNSMSLFQFLPKDFTPQDETAENKPFKEKCAPRSVYLNTQVDQRIKDIIGDKQIVRIDSGTFSPNGHACDVFRRCKKEYEESCFESDSYAGLFADAELYKLLPETEEYNARLYEVVKAFNDNKIEGKPSVAIAGIQSAATSSDNKITKSELVLIGEHNKNFQGRVYLYYVCPYSGFLEHIFPVYVKGGLVACLMVGQVALSCHKPSVGYFCKYLDAMKKMVQKEQNSDSDFVFPEIDDEKWTKLVQKVINRLSLFESRVEQLIQHRNEGFIDRKLDQILRNFQSEAHRLSIQDGEIMTKFSKCISTALRKVCSEFHGFSTREKDTPFIRIFAQPATTRYADLVEIGNSNGIDLKGSNCEFSLSKLDAIRELETDKIQPIREEMRNVERDSIEYKQLSEEKYQLKQGYKRILLDSGTKQIRRFYNAENDFLYAGRFCDNMVSFVVWERHSPELKTDEELFKALNRKVNSFYSQIMQFYYFIRGGLLEKQLEATIRTNSHETSQFLNPTLDILEKKLVLDKYIPQEMILSAYADEYPRAKDAFEKFKDEATDNLRQIAEITKGSSYIFKDIKVEPSKDVQMYYLLYGLKKMLDDKASNNHASISYKQNQDGLRMDVDEKLLRHALYNLMDNAIKYGHEGAKIRIQLEVCNQQVKIHVISYGFEIEESHQIYQLFYRSQAAEGVSEGTGVGLFVTEKICKALGGNISHTSEKISDMNIPVLGCNLYIHGILESEKEIFLPYKTEYLRLLENGYIEEVTHDRSFIKFPNVFLSRVQKPTYRNTFTITLPNR